jgi:hypothetical protein
LVSKLAWHTLLRNHPRNCNICTGFFLSNDFKKHSQGLVNIGNRQHLSSNVRLCRNLKFTLPMVTFVMRDKQNLLKNHTTPKNSICTMCKRNLLRYSKPKPFLECPNSEVIQFTILGSNCLPWAALECPILNSGL